LIACIQSQQQQVEKLIALNASSINNLWNAHGSTQRIPFSQNLTRKPRNEYGRFIEFVDDG